ncbi:MAG: hypothetical protein M1531_05540 [Chloroflexi bacterium]|nr:hypothetical protein [Chloroflexota bacterium]
MHFEVATVLVVVIGSGILAFLLMPLLIFLVRLPSIWRADRWVGALGVSMIVLTGAFFVLFLVGLVALTFSGATAK